jgi:hypothetical protein
MKDQALHAFLTTREQLARSDLGRQLPAVADRLAAPSPIYKAKPRADLRPTR